MRLVGSCTGRGATTLLSSVVLSSAVLLSGCTTTGEQSADDDEGRLQVLTTVAPLTSIVASIAGEHAQVGGLIPEGVDSHTFEAPPSVPERLARADVVFLNGLSLDEPIRKLLVGIQESDDRPRVVLLGDLALPESDRLYDRSFPRSEGRPNPHLWTNPRHALSYAQLIERQLSELDSAHAVEYRANLAHFEESIRALDEAMRACFATIPVSQRTLLTYHDAYAYFAQDYDFEIIGAVQPTNFSEPTPKQVGALIEQVRRLGVPAIFGSEVFPSPVLEQIGKEANVRYVDELRDDDLPGEPGDPGHSLIGMLRFNYLTITEALGGDASALRNLVPTDVDPASRPR